MRYCWAEATGGYIVRKGLKDAKRIQALVESNLKLQKHIEELKSLLTRVQIAEGRCPVALMTDIRKAVEDG